MEHQKAHKENKLLDITERKYYTKIKQTLHSKNITKLKGILNILLKYGVPLYEE